MANWKELAEELASELEALDDLVFPEEEDSQTDTDSDEDSESMVDRILEWHLQIENYYPDQQFEMLEALKKILNAGDLSEFYRIGVLLIYLSERRYVVNELENFLECY